MAYTTIDKPTDYFETKLYTGNGGTQNITGLDFAPDWVWLKSRSNGNYHNLCDTVRGVNKQLYSNDNTAEASKTTVLTAFNSDGFTLGSESDINGSGRTFVSWNWKAGTSFTNDASSTGIGTLDSSGSVNETAGFSIVSYTGNGSAGATVKHGLSTAPQFLIGKARNTSGEDWFTGNSSIGFNKYIKLNSTHAAQTFSGTFNDTAPNTSVVTLGNNGITNSGSYNYIMYCFSERKGYSKFGSYTGNGNTDGTFVYTGFKPAWVMLKATSATGSWNIADSKRSPENEVDEQVQANLSNAESTSFDFDFTSNGFKARTTDAARNGSGVSYIYMAFSNSSFVNSSGVPATAR